MQTTKKSILLILLSSLCAGIGQLFWKAASLSLSFDLSLFLNLNLIIGVLLYGLATILMVLSFRHGELSVMHPFLATSFVWVSLISPLFFESESIGLAKLTGVILIFFGVTFIGLGGRKK